MTRTLDELTIRIFADGADEAGLRQMAANPLVKGFTTNPTLMRKAGITDYVRFAATVLEIVEDRPVSFEVFADDFAGMEDQAREIARWGNNVFVKIPITDREGHSSVRLLRRLASEGIKVNVTAVLTQEQIRAAAAALADGPDACISVFAGRIADTGRDPAPMMAAAAADLVAQPRVSLIWASPRELLNLFQANDAGCHIITMTSDLLVKLPLVGRQLDEYSLETVRMFHDDAAKAGYDIRARSLGERRR